MISQPTSSIARSAERDCHPSSEPNQTPVTVQATAPDESWQSTPRRRARSHSNPAPRHLTDTPRTPPRTQSRPPQRKRPAHPDTAIGSYMVSALFDNLEAWRARSISSINDFAAAHVAKISALARDRRRLAALQAAQRAAARSRALAVGRRLRQLDLAEPEPETCSCRCCRAQIVSRPPSPEALARQAARAAISPPPAAAQAAPPHTELPRPQSELARRIRTVPSGHGSGRTSRGNSAPPRCSQP